MRGLIALLVLAALAVSACGSSEPLTRQEYAHKLVDVMKDLDWSGGADLQGLGEQADRYEDAADEMDEVTPPPDIAQAHERLIAGMRAYAAQLVELEDAGREGRAAFVREMEGYTRATTRFAGAFNELAAKGYAHSTR
jgi:hypothetical protein